MRTKPASREPRIVPVHGGSGSDAADGLVRAIRRRWSIVLLTALAAAAIAWTLAAMQPKRYRASVIAGVSPVLERLDAGEVLRGVDVLERRTLVATIAALASAPVTRMTAGATDPDYAVDAVVLPNTNLIRITVESGDRVRIAAVANRLPEVLSAQARAMYGFYRVTTLSGAATPRDPVFPRFGRAVAMGLLLGTLIGIVAAYLIERRRSPA